MPVALLLLALLAAASPARAQSGDAIQKHLLVQNPRCSLFAYQELHRGPVAGLPDPVVIAAFTIEGCVGNDYRRTVGVFHLQNGRIASFRTPTIEGPSPDDKGAFTLQGDRITIRSLAYGPNDPRCCPSLQRTAIYRLTPGAVTAVR